MPKTFNVTVIYEEHEHYSVSTYCTKDEVLGILSNTIFSIGNLNHSPIKIPAKKVIIKLIPTKGDPK